MYKYLIDVINELKNESSKNKKIEILSKYKNDPTLKLVCFLTYNNHIQFGIKKIPEYENIGGFDGLSLKKALLDIEKYIAGRIKTGQAAKDYLELTLASLIQEDADVLELVIKRSLDCGVSVSTVNKVWPGLIPVFEFMACEPWHKGEIKFPCIVQEKSDGMRLMMFIEKYNKYTMRTRNGKIFDDLGVFSEFAKNFVPGTIIDGEMLVIKDGMILPRKKG